MAIIFLEIVEAAAGLDTLCCRLREGCHCGRLHHTSYGQEHKFIWRAGPERDPIFHLRVTACREQGSHSRHKRLAWVASRWQGSSCSSSFVSNVLGANYNRANNFHPVADKFTMYTALTLNLPVGLMRMRIWITNVIGKCCNITITPNPAAFYLGHGHYCSHCTR